MNYEIGSRVGDYEVLEVLGAGGMGRVYKVRNVISDRIEAMKVLLPDLEGDAELADRFMREIKVQATSSVSRFRTSGKIASACTLASHGWLAMAAGSAGGATCAMAAASASRSRVPSSSETSARPDSSGRSML